MAFYRVDYCIRYPYRDGYVNKTTGLDYYVLCRSKTFHDYEKAFNWAKRWCPFDFTITTFKADKYGFMSGYIENYHVDQLDS